MLVGLAFLPLDQINLGFRSVCASIERGIRDNTLPSQLNQLVDYFASTYVGNITPGGNQR